MADYAKPDALVSTDWLEEQLNDPNVRIIEVDEDTTAYDKGDIRNAVRWDWSTDLHAAVGRDFKDRAGFSSLLAEAGVGEDTTVIVYGGNNNWFAAYAYWLLKLRGFEDVKLLNGGRKKWELESRELTQDEPSLTATGYAITGPERPEIRALRDEVIDKVGGSTGFVDVRSPEEFRGEKLAPDHLPQEQSQVPGHVAGGRAEGALRGRGHHARPRGHRVLPDRGALLAHVVRSAGAARVRRREELRRLVDRVRLPRRRTRRARLRRRDDV